MSHKERKLLRASRKNMCGAENGEGRNLSTTTTTLSTGDSIKFKEPSHWNYQMPTLSKVVVLMGRHIPKTGILLGGKKENWWGALEKSKAGKRNVEAGINLRGQSSSPAGAGWGDAEVSSFGCEKCHSPKQGFCQAPKCFISAKWANESFRFRKRQPRDCKSKY